MKITLEATSTIENVQDVPCRLWKGETASGTPVHAWIATMQARTHDAEKLAEFDRELSEAPYRRELVSFDLRMAT